MDRTIIAPYKAEEKELSEKLYNKLDGLTLIYPPNEEFKKHFSKDMFIKPNQAAFFQVFHYLFRIYDFGEFKKRFYWPLTDKRAESAFRSSTVEYLKFLSEKHNLNWNIKPFLVQMPGGMKFILFALEFAGFIIAEQIRMRVKQLGTNGTGKGLSEQSIKCMQRKHQFLKDYTVDYIEQTERQTLEVRRTTELIKAELNAFKSAIQVDIDNHFLNAFENSNKRMYETNFVAHGQKIKCFEARLKNFKSNIDKYQQRAREQRKNKSSMRQALNKLCDLTDDAAKPTMEHLIAAFNKLQPQMEDFLRMVVEGNASINGEMTTDLLRLQTEYEQTEAQITVCQQKYKNVNSKSHESTAECLLVTPNLVSKYVFTPPIKPTNFIKNLDSTLSARKPRPMITSHDVSTTLNGSRMIDPAQMLRMFHNDYSKRKVNKTTKPTDNLSMLSLKWKERQQTMFEDDIAENITPIKSNSSNVERLNGFNIDIKISSPVTPFNTHSYDVTRIALSSYKHSPSFKKVCAIKDDAINITNFSTSPSGRLEPLYPEDFASGAAAIEDKENNQDCINMLRKFSVDLNTLVNDEDFIFNTSDTVLKDIDM